MQRCMSVFIDYLSFSYLIYVTIYNTNISYVTLYVVSFVSKQLCQIDVVS